MRRIVVIALAVGALVAPLAVQTSAVNKNLAATLIGFSEVPAVSTGASGSFEARVLESGAVEYTLSYTGLEADATQAHIHFGRAGTNGGISVWLCSNLASPPTPAGVGPCPLRSGTVTGTADASDVVGPAGQGIEAGALSELLAAIGVGAAYANVHSTAFAGGEIRGQID